MKQLILAGFLFLALSTSAQDYKLTTGDGTAIFINLSDTSNIDTIKFPLRQLTYMYSTGTTFLQIWHDGTEKRMLYKSLLSNITINGKTTAADKLQALSYLNGGKKTNATTDAFSRTRVSNPVTLFDAQLTYNLQPLLYEQITTGTGASIAHDATNRNALLTFSNTAGSGKAIMQTFEHFRYQPSKSQLVFITFNMREAVTGCEKFAGYSDGTNGIEFRVTGTGPALYMLTGTGSGSDTIEQSGWNIDPLDGTGPSGQIIDISKTQIFVLDFQALYVGRVRCGFDIGGEIIYVHEFNHSNIETESYIQSANLPIRVGMTNTDTVSTTMDFICTAVVSEGGSDDITGFIFSQDGTVTAASGTRTHLMSIRPDTLFNGISNRSKITIEEVDILVTGANPVKWELVLGQDLSGSNAFLEVNSTYSAVDYNTAGTLSGSPAIVIASGYVASSGANKQAVRVTTPMRYPVTLNAVGLPRLNGTISLIVTGIGGTSATYGTIKWKEIR